MEVNKRLEGVGKLLMALISTGKDVGYFINPKKFFPEHNIVNRPYASKEGDTSFKIPKTNATLVVRKYKAYTALFIVAQHDKRPNDHRNPPMIIQEARVFGKCLTVDFGEHDKPEGKVLFKTPKYYFFIDFDFFHARGYFTFKLGKVYNEK